MLPGTTPDEKSASLELRTVPVPTQEVVAAGLLKTRLYLVDCNIAQVRRRGRGELALGNPRGKFAQAERRNPHGLLHRQRDRTRR